MNPSVIESTTAVAAETVAPGVLAGALQWIDAGGPVVVILLAMSVVAVTIVFLKLLQLRDAEVWNRGSIRRLFERLDGDDRRAVLAGHSSSHNPCVRLVVHALRLQQRGVAEDRIQEEIQRYGISLLEELRGWLRPLEVIASLAPLLGLFGTVLGMIEAFRQLEHAGTQVNPAVLAGGIWEALLTTAVGLAVAIPAIAVMHWFERVIERVGHEMEDAASRLLLGVTVDEPNAGGLRAEPILE